jgi:hypothetical protein
VRTVDESTIVGYSDPSLEIPRLAAYFPFESAGFISLEFYSVHGSSLFALQN